MLCNYLAWDKTVQLAQAVQHHGGLLLALDGLAPEGGEPQLWFIRELFTFGFRLVRLQQGDFCGIA